LTATHGAITLTQAADAALVESERGREESRAVPSYTPQTLSRQLVSQLQHGHRLRMSHALYDLIPLIPEPFTQTQTQTDFHLIPKPLLQHPTP